MISTSARKPRGVGPQFAEGIADRNLHRLQNLDKAAERLLRHDAGLIDRGDEGGRAAVHDRNFGAVDFDDGVVNAHAAQGSEHMFRGGNQRTFAIAENGGKFGRDDGFGGGRNFAVRAIKSGTDKNKTRVDGRRSNGKIYRLTGVNANARHGGLRAKRGLTAEFHSRTAPLPD